MRKQGVDQLRALAAAYVASLIAFLVLDAIWLSLSYRHLYKPGLGPMLRDAPMLAPAIAFYLLYALGITVLITAAAPADSSAIRALGLGALLGLVAYGTYDLSNLATLRGWPVMLTIADMGWGAIVTALSAGAGLWAARMFS